MDFFFTDIGFHINRGLLCNHGMDGIHHFLHGIGCSVKYGVHGQGVVLSTLTALIPRNPASVRAVLYLLCRLAVRTADGDAVPLEEVLYRQPLGCSDRFRRCGCLAKIFKDCCSLILLISIEIPPLKKTPLR